jgi:fatty acid desaturase
LLIAHTQKHELAMQGHTISSSQAQHYHRLNLRLLALHAFSSLAILFALPVAARFGGETWAYGAMILALLSNGHWALLHEALHGGLFPSRTLNRSAGRALAVLFGSSFRLLRFFHLSHHLFNRHPLDRPDAYDPTSMSWVRAYCAFLFQTMGGHYLGEVFLPAFFWMPKRLRDGVLGRILNGPDSRLTAMRRQAQSALSSPQAVREIRTDNALAFAAIAISCVLWGPLWPYLFAALAIRAFLISYVDNLYHFRTPIDRPEFARSLRLPVALQTLILNANLHQTHHRAMHLPWWRLPEAFNQENDRFDGDFFAIALGQLRGPAPVAQLKLD